MRQFLIERKVDLGLHRVTVFDSDRKALKAYEAAENRGVNCVLLGADRLGTLLRTHGTWFDEPSRDLVEVLDA